MTGSDQTMASFIIETLMPSSGAVPVNGYDAGTGAGFTGWRIRDEARFSIVVPVNYIPGKDLSIQLHESSVSPSLQHGWQVTALLLRADTNAANQVPITETSSAAYRSAAISDMISRRIFSITGTTFPGRVADTAIMPGDLLSFVLTRIPAPQSEDPGLIKVFQISVEMILDSTRLSNCAGRVGEIIDSVRDLFNESTDGFLSDEFILRSINRCLKDLAQENYWRRQTWIPTMSGVFETDLVSVIPDFQDLHQMCFSGKNGLMTPLRSLREFLEIRNGENSHAAPLYYTVQNGSLYVWPPPHSDISSGFCVYHSYLPAGLTCSPDNPNPPMPRAGDQVFVYFSLREAFLRDRHAPGADLKYQEYSQLYEREKQRLLGASEPPSLSLRPSR